MFKTDFWQDVDIWKINPIEILAQPTETVPYDQSVIDRLIKLGEWADVLVLWLDWDREGENICFEIINVVDSLLPSPSQDYIFRAKFSSLVPKDIKNSFDNLIHKPDYMLSASVDARRIIDLKVGVAFTVYQTRALKYKRLICDPSIKCVSYGPCQFPTMHFCAQNDE